MFQERSHPSFEVVQPSDKITVFRVQEVKSRALAQMGLEEDDSIINTICTRHVSESASDRKAFIPKTNNWWNHPYNRPIRYIILMM